VESYAFYENLVFRQNETQCSVVQEMECYNKTTVFPSEVTYLLVNGIQGGNRFVFIYIFWNCAKNDTLQNMQLRDFAFK